jgi:hypothetical protein
VNWLHLKELTLKDFGPFEGTHKVQFPKAGFYLVRGKVSETGAGSGAGKSYLLKAISHLFGGCKDPATELQSWFTKEPPEASAIIETSKGDIVVKRRKGLSISGELYKEPIKGNAGEAELDQIFGMSEEARAICTYRGQRKPGLFLSLSDENKKTFLWNLLELGAYEKVANAAQEKVKKLEAELVTQSSQADFCFTALVNGRESLNMAELALGALQPFDPAALQELKTQIEKKRNELANNQRAAEAIRLRSSNELEAVLAVNRAKIKKAYEAKEPIEITGLKTTLDGVRKSLDEAKEKDAASALQISKQRNELNISINSLRSAVSHRVKIQKDLDAAHIRAKTLSSQKCSECKREWVGSDAEATLADVKKTILGLQDALLDIQVKEDELAGQVVRLQGIKPHEADPNIAVLQDNLAAIAENIKTKTNAFEAARRQRIFDLEQEDKKTKEQFAIDLARNLQAVTQFETAIQGALRSDLSEEQTLVSLKSQAEVKKAVVNERKLLAASLETSHKVAVEKRDQTKQALNLEKDVVALVGRQGFLGSIVEEVLVEIAAAANDILSQVANVRHLSVDFETEKVAETTGNAKARITLCVFSRGRKVSFASGISGGMQIAVELAVDLAVGDVVSRRRGSWPNWLVLDECFDGLGGPDKESCLEMLQNHSGDRLILVVDHDSSFQGLFNNTIEIEMTDGRSRIVV